MSGMYDNTQPELWDAIDQFGETQNAQIHVTEHHQEALLLGPDGQPLQYEQPQRIGFILEARK